MIDGNSERGAAALGVPPWPDTPLARLEMLAVLQSLQAALLDHDSATLVLEEWCARHRLAPAGTRVVAERVRDTAKPVTDDQRRALRVSAGERVAYRRVRLRGGAHILSEADNWYVPARLTPAMNQALESSDIAFGRAVRSLQFRRQTLSARLLWSPLPTEGGGHAVPPPATRGGTLAVPERLIEHRAILMLPDGTPFSQVVETYGAANLAFAPPVWLR